MLDPTHSDYPILSQIKADIEARLGAKPSKVFGEGILEAVDFVLDPQRTGRTEIDDLDRVEKAFIGLKVEHFVRDMLGADAGVRDLRLGDFNVDIKNTIRKSRSWMIPKETYLPEEPVLLIASDPKARTSSMGLMMARDAYLSAENRDKKRGVKAEARAFILWIMEDHPWPPSRWDGLDMDRFRDLRINVNKGADRAAAFFKENLNRPTHRSVLLSLLHDQYDPMKRLRGNGGARDELKHAGIALMSKHYGGKVLESIGRPIGPDEFIAFRPTRKREINLLREKGHLI